MASECEGTSTGKTSWPELLGAQGEAAAETIKLENPTLNVVVLLVGTIVTTEFDEHRVRVWVDECGIVKEVPKIG